MEKLQKKYKKNKIVIFITIVIVVMAVSVIFVLGNINRQNEIEKSVEIGNRYLSELRYDEAIACFQEVLEIDPKNSEVSFALAEAYEGKGMYAYAENIYQDLLQDDVDKVQAYLNLAELYIKEEKLEEAKELLEQAKQELQDESIDEMYVLVNPSAPTVSHAPGTYAERIQLELVPEEEGQKIYYTLDGSEPTEQSDVYEKPLILRNGGTTVKAVAVNTIGYRSEVAEFSYNIPIQDVEITVEEPAIERMIREYLGLSYMDPIYNDDIEQITELYIVSSQHISAENNENIVFEQYQYEINGYSMTPYGEGQISTLNDLKYMPFLERVAVEYQSNLDISALAECTSIKELSLMGNNLDTQDIQVIAGLTQLEKLNLGWNQITDISAVSGLGNLMHLSIWGNSLSSISPVVSCRNLTYLDFADNQVEDISMLSRLDNLQQLWMYQNQVRDISVVANMDKLQVLMLRDNPIANPESVRPIYAHLIRLDVDLLGLGADIE